MAERLIEVNAGNTPGWVSVALMTEEDSDMDSDRNLDALAAVPVFGQLWLNGVNAWLALSDARNMLNERLGQAVDTAQSDAIERVLAGGSRASESSAGLKAVA